MDEKNILNEDFPKIKPYIERPNNITITKEKEPNIFVRVFRKAKSFIEKVKDKVLYIFKRKDRDILSDSKSNADNFKDKEKEQHDNKNKSENEKSLEGQEKSEKENQKKKKKSREKLSKEDKKKKKEEKKATKDARREDRKKKKEEKKTTKEARREDRKIKRAKISRVIVENEADFINIGYSSPNVDAQPKETPSKSHQSPENEKNVYKYDKTNDIMKEGADVAKDDIVKDENGIKAILNIVFKQENMSLDMKLTDGSIIKYTHEKDQSNNEKISVTHIKDNKETTIIEHEGESIEDDVELTLPIVLETGMYREDVLKLGDQMIKNSDPVEKIKSQLKEKYKEAIGTKSKVKCDLTNEYYVIFNPVQFSNKKGELEDLCNVYLYESKNDKLVDVLYKTEKGEKNEKFIEYDCKGKIIGSYDEMINKCVKIIASSEMSLDDIIANKKNELNKVKEIDENKNIKDKDNQKKDKTKDNITGR